MARTCTSCGLPSPVLFPQDFYLRTYGKGIDGILIAACGSNCLITGRMTAWLREDDLTGRMKQGGLEIERIRLTAICTVCIKPYLKEVSQLNDALKRLGPVNRQLARQLAKGVSPQPVQAAIITSSIYGRNLQQGMSS